MSKVLVAVSAALFSMVPASSVLAGTLPVVAQRSDPEDVEGRLDVVRTRVRVGDRRVRLVVETAEKWRCRYVTDDSSTAEGAAAVYDDGTGVFLFWEFDTDKNAAFELDAFIRCKDGDLRLVSDDLDREVAARRPNRRTVVATVARKRWDLASSRLQLRAVSQINGTDGSDVYVEERDQTRRLKPFRRS